MTNKDRYQIYELFNYADGNDDILSDTGDSGDIKRGMWAQVPYSVSDGPGVINEEFIDFVNNRDSYPDKPISNLPLLTDRFHECIDNISEVLKAVENKPRFLNNLKTLQEYIIRRGFFNGGALMNESEIPKVDYGSLDDKDYAIKLANEFANKMGLSNPKYLDGGGFGHAFEINNDVVLKLTSDMGEADAASKLLRTNPKNLGEIYNLYKILDTEENRAFFAILEENIWDKPMGRLQKYVDDINLIQPNGIDYSDIIINIKKPQNFNHDKMVEFGKHILTDNPDAGVSKQDRKAAYDFFIGIMNIRQELLDYDIKSVDYVELKNLGYNNGVLKFFDIGGHMTPEPRIGDDNVVKLPEDGSAKFSSDTAINQDEFPPYNTNDTSPSINNDLDANIAMYEDLIYNHIVGDATKDKYQISEVVEGGEYHVYHGSEAKIEKFVDTFVGSENSTDQEGPGIYFTTSPEDARRYGKYIYAAILRPNKLVDESSHEDVNEDELIQLIRSAPDWEMTAQNWAENPETGLREAIDSFMRYSENEKDLFQQVWYDFFRYYPVEFLRGMVKLGYDGQIIDKANGVKHIIIYNPDIIEHIDTEALDETRKKSWMPGSKSVKVKRRCQLGGKADGTSDACNQGDINNLEFGSLNEVGEGSSQPYPFHERENGSTFDFVTEDGDNYVVEFDYGGNDWFSLMFQVVSKNEKFPSNYSDVVNKGRMYRVMATIIKIIEDFVSIYDVNGLVIEPTKTRNEYDDRRFLLYLSYIEKHLPPEYEMTKNRKEIIIKKKGLDEYFSSLVPDDDVDEGVGDKYAEKFGVKPEFSDFEDRFKAHSNIENKENIIRTRGTTLIKNPKNLNNLGSSVRGIIDKNGDLYVETSIGLLHDHIISFIDDNGLRLIKSHQNWRIEKPTEFITVQRKGETNEFQVGESNILMQPDELRLDVYDEYNLIPYEKAKQYFEKFMERGRRKNPNIRFVNQIIGLEVLAKQMADEREMRERNRKAQAEMKAEMKAEMERKQNMGAMNESDIMSLQDLPFKDEVQQLGGKIYSVGGAVRDEFLGKESKDLDLLITGIPQDDLLNLLSKYGRVSLEGDSFGVLIFKPHGSDENMDIAIPRTEKPTGGGGHQDFEITTDHTLPIEKDLERRDFTINAIAKDIDGNIVDPYNGQDDLNAKVIRAVNPDAFRDDPLRMLRAVQFASRFGFTIEPKTYEMIKNSAAEIQRIKPERILIEFDKIITKGNPQIGIQLLADTGLYQQIFGNQIKPSQIGRRDFSSVKTMAELLFLMMYGVVHNPPEFFLNKFSNEDAKKSKIYKEMLALQEAFDSDAQNQQMTPVQARSVAHNMFKIAPHSLNSQVLPEQIERAAQEFAQGKYPKTVNDLAVNGHDLMQKGLKGDALGKMQKSMLIKVYADIIRNDKEDLLSLVDEKSNEVQEGFAEYSRTRPDTWNVKGEEVDLGFFIDKYDKWNNKFGSAMGFFNNPTRESVQLFLRSNFEELTTDEKLNKHLYWTLMDRELLNENTVEKVAYSGVVLDETSRKALLKVFKPMIPEGWEVVAHHMTIKMGALQKDSQEKLDMSGGTQITLNVIDYAMDDMVLAVGVEGYPTKNEKPHITIAVNRADGGKPFLSNKLTDWKLLGFPLKLTGKVEEIKN